MNDEMRLTPPWYTLRNELAYSIGADPNIHVSQLSETSSGYDLVISVANNSKLAQCVRAIIPAEYVIGNIVVTAKIYDACTNSFVPKEDKIYATVEDLTNEFNCALRNNPYVKGLSIITNDQPPPVGNLSVIIAKSVIQFFNDDISDLYGNYNAAAADTFRNVVEQEFLPYYQVTFSTYDCKTQVFSGLDCCE